MGNDLSCVHHSALATCAASPTYRRRPPLITIISPLDGCARRFKEPLNVGELMLAMPGHFVAELNGQEQDGYMLRSKRISALPEDRNLSALHVYYLFPKHRLNTHLGTSELRKFVMAARLDVTAGGATPYSGYITHATSRIAPLSSPHCEEALLGSNVKRRQPAYQRQPVRARTHRRKLLEKDNLHAHRLANVGGGRVTLNDGEAGAHELAARLQRSVSKPRSWEPKLETIAELRTSG